MPFLTDCSYRERRDTTNSALPKVPQSALPELRPVPREANRKRGLGVPFSLRSLALELTNGMADPRTESQDGEFPCSSLHLSFVNVHVCRRTLCAVHNPVNLNISCAARMSVPPPEASTCCSNVTHPGREALMPRHWFVTRLMRWKSLHDQWIPITQSLRRAVDSC